MYNNYCYKFVQIKKTWPEAKTQCESLGSYLVTTHSLDESEFVFSLMSASGSNMWIGGNDIAAEGTWVWEDGEIWGGFTAWNDGEPNGGVSEQCIALLDYKNAWYDVSCGSVYNFMCKKRGLA